MVKRVKESVDLKPIGNDWYSDTVIADYKYEIQVKMFDEPSYFGINNGRISKLWIRNLDTGKTVCNYDRGWDIKPTSEVKPDYREIIKKYN